MLSLPGGALVSRNAGRVSGPASRVRSVGLSLRGPNGCFVQATGLPQRLNRRDGRGVAASEGAAFFLGQSAPDSGILTGLDGPFQAGLSDLASTAKVLGLFGLQKRRLAVPGREEQLGVHAQTNAT
jgi:hypothetical protein